MTTRSTWSSSARAPAAARWPSAWRGAGWKVVVLESGPFWDPDARLGLRRGRLAQALLDRGARHRRRGSGRAGQEQLRPRRRRLDGPLRRLLPALSPLRLRGRTPRRRGRGLADLLRGPEAPLRAPRARAAGGRRALAVGRPARLPAHRPSRSPAAPSSPGPARASSGSRCGSGPVGITNGAFGNRPHCIYRGFCLQGCKVNAKASPLVTHIPDAIEHGAEIRADCMATRIELDESSAAGSPACATSTTGRSASSAPMPSRWPGTRSRRRGCC